MSTALLCVLVVCSFAAIVELPIQPYWTSYIQRERSNLLRAGTTIDRLKLRKRYECPVGVQGYHETDVAIYSSSLVFFIDALDKALQRFEASIVTMEGGGQMGRDELDRYMLEEVNNAKHIYQVLLGGRNMIAGYVRVFVEMSMSVDLLPGRVYPNTRSQDENMVTLATSLDDVQVIARGTVSMDTDRRELFLDWLSSMSSLMEKGFEEMDSGMMWASIHMHDGAFSELISDMAPNTPGEDGGEGESSSSSGEGGDDEEEVNSGGIDLGTNMDGRESINDRAVENNNNNGDTGMDASAGEVFDVAEVFDRAARWFDCWREGVVLVAEGVEAIGPVPYPPQWVDVVEEDEDEEGQQNGGASQFPPHN
ncbi:hypothetical protein H072_2738 [Dactylellina haptotyla CBS 200.50]|uniref:Uncharacterized protein n=1 Tax=Dactylellina haptotyla (strain CBS 200.50) TaxID=1284197 RepID=S8C6B3_DACHA|nr:hypothetical protein H072_2738 [Dactylellina haptotyla CBS 200.50]